MIRPAAEILADLAAGGEVERDSWDEPDYRPDISSPWRRRGGTTYADVDLSIGLFAAGWADIRRHAHVWAGDTTKQPKRGPGRPRKGCPSLAQYRRHRAAGTYCQECAQLVATRAAGGGR